VLDEADVMISQQGHRDLSVRIFNILEKNSPGLQSMLFSATYDEPVQNFAKELIKDPFTITYVLVKASKRGGSGRKTMGGWLMGD